MGAEVSDKKGFGVLTLASDFINGKYQHDADPGRALGVNECSLHCNALSFLSNRHSTQQSVLNSLARALLIVGIRYTDPTQL